MNTITTEKAARLSFARLVTTATTSTLRNPLCIDGRRALTTMQAARYLGTVDAVTLVRWQQEKEPTAPPSFEHGGQILYYQTDLKTWQDRRPTT